MNIKRKLQSNKGASMILVLALFLVCIMVSSVVMAAASSGVSRNAKRAKQQNGYLAVSSATDLILEELDNIGVYVGEEIERRYGCEDCTVEGYFIFGNDRKTGYRLDAEYTTNPLDKDYVSNPLDDGHLLIPPDQPHDNHYQAVMSGDDTTLDGIFKDMYVRACTQVFASKSDYTEEIKIKLSEEDARLAEVHCVFKMDMDYSVSFTLSTEESDYAVLISAVGEKTDGTPKVTTDTSDMHTIYYKKYIIKESDGTETQKSGSYEDKKETWSIPVEVTTTKTTISWSEPKVEKEVLSQ